MKKQEAVENNSEETALPYKLYNMTEVAVALNVSVKYIRTLRKAGAPFHDRHIYAQNSRISFGLRV